MDAMGSRDATPAGAGRGRGRLGRNGDGDVVLQLIEAAIGDHVSGVDAGYLRDAAVGDSRRYAARVRDIVLNQIDKRRLPILLNGR